MHRAKLADASPRRTANSVKRPIWIKMILQGALYADILLHIVLQQHRKINNVLCTWHLKRLTLIQHFFSPYVVNQTRVSFLIKWKNHLCMLKQPLQLHNKDDQWQPLCCLWLCLLFGANRCKILFQLWKTENRVVSLNLSQGTARCFLLWKRWYFTANYLSQCAGARRHSHTVRIFMILPQCVKLKWLALW